MCCKSVCSGLFMGGLFLILMACFAMAILFSYIISNINKKNSFDGQTHAYEIDVGAYSRKDEDGKEKTMYNPTYYFTAYFNGENKNFTCHTTYSTSARPDLSNDLVYYNKSNPYDCITEFDLNGNIIFYFCLLFLLIFVGIGIFLILSGIKSVIMYGVYEDNYENKEINDTQNLKIDLTSASSDFNYNQINPANNNYKTPVYNSQNINNYNYIYPTSNNY